MARIETQFSTHLPVETLYETIRHPENIPLYAPGIAQAQAFDTGPSPPEAAENLVNLVTRSGRHLTGKIVEAEPARTLVVRDQNGTEARWELIPTADGTLARYTLEGRFDPGKVGLLRAELRAKLARLVVELEG